MRSFFKKLLIRIISYVIFALLNILKPIIKVKIGRIHANRIGHLGYNLDNYLTFTSNKNKLFTFFCYDEPISNIYLFNILKKNKRIFFSNKIKFLYFEILEINSKSSLLVSFKDELHPAYSFVSSSKRNIPVIDNLSTLKEFLSENKIKKKYICIHNRDNQYLDRENFNDQNFHEFRDYKIQDLESSVRFLTDKGYCVIRIGKKNKDKLDIKNENYFDLTNDYYNEALQIQLIENCLFFVGCNSGVTIVPRLFRKPTLIINYIPFNLYEMTAWSAKSIFLPKKILNKSNNKILSFKEMNDLDYTIHNKKDFFSEMNLKVVSNTSEEILKSVEEMLSFVENNFIRSREVEELNDKFWLHFQYNNEETSKKIKDIKKLSNFCISKDFLLENMELLKN